MGRAFVQLNGVEYELATPMEEPSLGQLRERLQQGTGRQTLQVLVGAEKVRVDLVVELERLWGAAAWLVPAEGAPSVW